MPELITMTAWTCRTNVGWVKDIVSSSGDKTYTVRWGPIQAQERSYEYGWTCTCLGFKYHNSCTHIKTTRESGARCAWNADLDPAIDYNRKGQWPQCPSCGGPVKAYKVAV